MERLEAKDYPLPDGWTREPPNMPHLGGARFSKEERRTGERIRRMHSDSRYIRPN